MSGTPVIDHEHELCLEKHPEPLVFPFPHCTICGERIGIVEVWCELCDQPAVRNRPARCVDHEEPAGDGGSADESPNYARAQRVNRNVPGWRARL
jgi:hypothetical protein